MIVRVNQFVIHVQWFHFIKYHDLNVIISQLIHINTLMSCLTSVNLDNKERLVLKRKFETPYPNTRCLFKVFVSPYFGIFYGEITDLKEPFFGTLRGYKTNENFNTSLHILYVCHFSHVLHYVRTATVMFSWLVLHRICTYALHITLSYVFTNTVQTI